MSAQDPEEEFVQEPVESEENNSHSDEPVLSESDSVHQAPPASTESTETNPEGPAWYVIHCYSGYENKVRQVGS